MYNIISGGSLAIPSIFLDIVNYHRSMVRISVKTKLDELPVLGNSKVFRCGILLIVIWTA